jgi:hypothetical protein
MRTIVVLMLSVLSIHAQAACFGVSTPARPRLVELYSSEGCSSCPPAEAWLRTLDTGGTVVPLEFHVDYWDSLGWRDRFADHRYTQRQQEQSKRDRSDSVFTPQIVLDGHNWNGWYKDSGLPSPAHTAASLRLAAEGDKPLHVRLDVTFDDANFARDYRSFVVLTENGLASDVRAGENSGAQLKHDHVVRAFVGPLATDHSDIEIQAPEGVRLDKSTLVAFVQNPRDGDVAQIISVPLTQCRQ